MLQEGNPPSPVICRSFLESLSSFFSSSRRSLGRAGDEELERCRRGDLLGHRAGAAIPTWNPHLQLLPSQPTQGALT